MSESLDKRILRQMQRRSSYRPPADSELEEEMERPAFVGLNAQKSIFDKATDENSLNRQQSAFDRTAVFQTKGGDS